tara:strand:- start:36132 stop:36365 length:234 start_codon:yes stop_codon:yes gene_type:complete
LIVFKKIRRTVLNSPWLCVYNSKIEFECQAFLSKKQNNLELNQTVKNQTNNKAKLHTEKQKALLQGLCIKIKLVIAN